MTLQVPPYHKGHRFKTSSTNYIHTVRYFKSSDGEKLSNHKDDVTSKQSPKRNLGAKVVDVDGLEFTITNTQLIL